MNTHAQAAPGQLRYCVEINDPQGHYFDVTLHFEWSALSTNNVGDERIVLRLPTWIPGSYLIREFSKNVLEVFAKANGQSCRVVKQRKDEWAVVLEKPTHVTDSTSTPIQMECHWRVYAWDLSVRGAHLDESHAFFNGTSLFLVPEGMEALPIELRVKRRHGRATDHPSFGSADWQVACGLHRADGEPASLGLLKAGGEIAFNADNYDALIDHPFEAGQLQTGFFEARGVPHYFTVYGADDDLDIARICRDLKPVCEAQIDLFEPETGKAPFEQYWFMLHATDNGYGGLEHRNSTALVCSRADLPQVGVSKAPDGYETFMGLCSHEYFHSWNVKRMKPAAFTPYRLEAESYTRLLWVFEGFTSYYDDLILARVGQLDEKAYLKALGKTIAQVHKGPGRHVQTVAESSFEAWTKYYRQDENASNAIVSYYTKGALVAFCLDALIRERTQHDLPKSLDDVMRLMWQKHGLTGEGVPEDGMAGLIEAATGLDLSEELQRFTQTTEELPLDHCLGVFGYILKADYEQDTVNLGLVGQFSEQGCKVKQVYNGGAAHKAGVSAGDVLVAVGERKMTEATYKRLLARGKPGEHIELWGFRTEKFLKFRLELGEPQAKSWSISETVSETDHKDQQTLLAPWKDHA